MKNIRHIFWYIKKYKTRYIIGVLSLVLCYVAIPIPTWVVGRIIDMIKTETLTRDALYKFVGLTVIASVGLYILEYIWHYFIFGHAFQAGRDNRRRLVSKILKQNPVFFHNNSTGALMSKATQDVTAIEALTGWGILLAFDAIVYPLVLVIIMGTTISWKLTLISIVFLPLLIVVTDKLGKRLHKMHLRTQKLFENLNESVMENITSIRVVKGFSTQEATQKRFEKAAGELYNSQMEQGKLHSWFHPAGRLIPSLSFIISLLVGQALMKNGELTLGQMTSFFLYLNMLVWPMFAFGDLINVVQESSASIKRLEDTYTYKEDLVNREEAIEFDGNGTIEFKNFGFRYPGEKTYALKNINVKIKKGETLGIVGKIGSGKTTFVKQLLRFYEVEEGLILFGDRPVEQYTIESIRDKMGYVPQQHLLFSKSVYKNIAFGKDNATEKDVMDSIEFADFTKDLDTLPHGLDTLIGEKGISISGGQKQRISISRAVIKNPEVLILDDSLSAVDSITEKKIISNIQEQRKGKTTVIVAHRLSGLKHADNIIVLDKGEIIESGTHEMLLANKGWYYEQYESQKSGGSDE